MATVTELLDRGSKLTGLRTTGTERQLALDALQDAYRRALMDTEASVVFDTYTFVSSADDYTFATMLGEQPLKLSHVTLSDSDGSTPLTQVSFQELLDSREVDVSTGTPYLYAAVGFEGLAFHPNPAVGQTVTIWYIEDTPALVEADPSAGEESTPTKIPVQFHYSVLLSGMVIEMLQKDQRAAEWQLWNDRYEKGIARMQEWIGQFGGEANRAYVKKGLRRFRFNDQRSRW